LKKPKRYLVTAALPYANGPLHIGHIAGAYLPADIYVRYLRLKGEDVKFICGSDEHGIPITLRARNEGKTPQQVVDYYHPLIKKTFERFGISFDIYHRTSDKLHHETASEFFLTLNKKGEFTREESEQYYDEEARQFLADRYIEGTCPNCGNDKAYGDQCEKCGKSLSPSDLINPRSTLSGKPPVKKKTTHWFLPLDKYQKEWLNQWIDEKRNVWKTNVYGQCKSWLDQGLQPRAVTRDLDWGVPVPLPEAAGKVLYVWFDAPIGYISATKALLPNGWKKYWQDKDTRLVHFIGKDNIVFHCIIFPAMLKAHGEYILPDHVPANEFLNLEGGKLSTSRNWAIWLHEYLDEFPGKEDVLRYVLCSIMPETKDSEFMWKDFQARNNNELVATLGNYVNRVLVLTHKYYKGLVPDAKSEAAVSGMKEAVKKIEALLDEFKFRDALTEVFDIVRSANKSLTDAEPWKKFNSDEASVRKTLYAHLQLIASLSVIMEPFLPFTAINIRKMLSIADRKLAWLDAGNHDLLKAGHPLKKAEILFEKMEDAVIQKQIDKLFGSAQPSAPVSAAGNGKPSISYDEFSKLDLRVGKILSAEKVPNADKLLKLQVDIGTEKRIIVSGIAQFFKPEEIIGTKVSLVANLAPKKIKGIESHGMILMAEDETGRLVFVSPVGEIKEGSGIK